ncbi:MAG: hypothetical protein VKP57_02795 [Candidatus Sericytochromatia bacterium]|nr:hypothetical protein [Candidatus Sericytochromatia bacterium]
MNGCDAATPFPPDLLASGGLNSEWARAAFADRLAAYPTHPRHGIRNALFAQLEDMAGRQSAAGWPDMPEAYRSLAVSRRLHLQSGLPQDLRGAVAYQAYYFALSPKARRAARARDNGVHLAWCPYSTFFV